MHQTLSVNSQMEKVLKINYIRMTVFFMVSKMLERIDLFMMILISTMVMMTTVLRRLMITIVMFVIIVKIN